MELFSSCKYYAKMGFSLVMISDVFSFVRNVRHLTALQRKLRTLQNFDDMMLHSIEMLCG